MSAAEQRKLLEALMGKEALGGPPDTIKFYEDSVCRDYLCGLCPHDLFTNTKVDLGPCPRKHNEKLKKDYEEAVRKKESIGYEEEWTRSLMEFIADIDRKIELARKRRETTMSDSRASGLMTEIDDLSNEIAVLTAQMEKLGEEGNVDESMKILSQVEELQKSKSEKERELKVIAAADMNSNQNFRVCGICSACLGVFDSDRRLADHFQGKMHLGYKQIRDKVEELRKLGFGVGGRPRDRIPERFAEVGRGGGRENRDRESHHRHHRHQRERYSDRDKPYEDRNYRRDERYDDRRPSWSDRRRSRSPRR
ncbi:small nuclear ribonucleoprotein [Zopfochytrium polystomum]|nr:small nuclear ribonucleoprotein [Zopfochytrium polystomum]